MDGRKEKTEELKDEFVKKVRTKSKVKNTNTVLYVIRRKLYDLDAVMTKEEVRIH